jgi:alpha-D-ribose 1-methylphosphonate 5-triphosphate synthase subunit PhnI
VEPKDLKQPEVEDLTVDRYLDIKSELKLLKKMQGDYEKKIELLTKEKEDFQTKNLTSRNKLVEC